MSNEQAKQEAIKPPLRLISLSITYGLFSQIKNNTSHNGEIVCEQLINPNIEADFFHNSTTVKSLNESKAIELFTRLIRQGYKITFEDEHSLNLIKMFSPPIFDRFYSTTNQ